MKVYEIALATFIFSYLLSFVSGLGIVPGYSIDPGEGYMSQEQMETYATKMNQTLQNPEGGVMGNVNVLVANVQMFLSTLPLIFESLFYSTVGLPLLLSSIQVPVEVIGLITPIVWFIYVYGIFQIMSGKDMEEE